MRTAVPINSAVIFSHPQISQPLVISTGANEMSWPYNLNISVTPTLGGEVIQILSANVGEFSISGTTRSNDQLKMITDWFRKYLSIAGLNQRTQEPILFQYPARDWSLHMWVKRTPNLHYDTTLIGAPWEIVAEINSSPNLNALVTHTMSTYTQSITPHWLASIGFLGESGANASRLSDPSLQSDNAGIDNIFENIGRSVASLANGKADFLNGFDPTANPDTQFDKSIPELYKDLFGSNSLDPNAASTSDGTGGTGSGGTPTTQDEYVLSIVDAFEARDVPGALGVAIGLVESTLNPNAWNGSFLGMYQTNPSGRGGSAPHKRHVADAYNAVKGTNAGPKTVISQKYPAGEQIEDAAFWISQDAYRPSGASKDTTDATTLRKWAVYAQLGSDHWPNAQGNAPYSSDSFPSFLTRARAMIRNANSNANSGGTATLSGLPTGKALSDAVLNHTHFLGTDGSDARDDIRQYIARGVKAITIQGILAIMNAGWDVHLSVIRSGHGNDGMKGHNPGGLAADFNNYGPGGAASSSGGTSSKDPTAFVSFLKKNRVALGNIKIGGGASDAQHRAWGTDFPDKDNHIHIQWAGQ